MCVGVINLRLRKKPWIEQAIQEYADTIFVYPNLPKPTSWQAYFNNDNPLYLEIGTGRGRFITSHATNNPDKNFIGIEAYRDVIYCAGLKIDEQKLTNVKMINADANYLEEWFGEGLITKIFINFCDPWPKKRHAKRRLTHKNFLEKYKQILVPNGSIAFKTDNVDLFEFSLEEFMEYGLKIKNVTYDLHQETFFDNVYTEYEYKFTQRGCKINFCECEYE